ncbi:MAG: alkaline phosphatase [Proteobacteria bacterium]|nr:alkaline phosphatase [Pseudomonadota bacterium]
MSKNVVKSTLLGLLTLLLILPIQAETADKEVKNIVVIGWDGAERNRTKELLGKGELPNLAALIREGKLLDIDVVSGATDTKAGWTQILTGYVPEKTGVYNNGRYEPIPEGYTVFERLEKFFGPDNIDTVAIIGKKFHVDNDPPYFGTLGEWTLLSSNKLKKLKKTNPNAKIEPDPAVYQEGGRIVEKDGRQIVEIPGKPWYHASKHLDLWVNGLEENEKVAALAIAEMENRKGRRFFFFIHFAQPDHSGHQFGENSQEYIDGIKSDDKYSGWIISKLKELGLYDKTLVYVTADHGFDKDKKRHLYAPFIFTATNDPMVVRGEGTREDLAPTILKKFGLDLSKIEPKLDGYPFDMQAPTRKANPELTEEYRHKYNYIDNRENNAKKIIKYD